MVTSFTIPGNPKGKARPRVNTNTRRAYTPEKTKQYEKTVQYSYLSAHPAGQRFHIGPCSVEIMACFAVPTSWSRKKQEMALMGLLEPEVKPDCDNIAKAVLDALNGLAYKDDSQVTKLAVKKCYEKEGCVRVRICSGEVAP